jgi:hypothetical protein
MGPFLAPVLALDLLVAAHGGCYVVTNTRIAILPTCDFGPATIEQLTEEPSPGAASGAVARPWYPPRSAAPVWGRRVVGAPGDGELQSRLAVAEQEKLAATSARVAAEQARDAAVRERDRAVRELVRVRSRLAATRARRGPPKAPPPDPARVPAPRRHGLPIVG